MLEIFFYSFIGTSKYNGKQKESVVHKFEKTKKTKPTARKDRHKKGKDKSCNWLQIMQATLRCDIKHCESEGQRKIKNVVGWNWVRKALNKYVT